MTILSSAWNRLHVVFFFLRREILHGPLCLDDTYILLFPEEEQHGPEKYLHGPCARLTRIIQKCGYW